VGLDVDVVGAVQFLRAVDCQLFDLVGVLAAAVVALAGVALGVLVRQRRALGFEHCFADVILGGDHRQCVVLALDLAGERVRHCRVLVPDVVVVHVCQSTPGRQ